MCHMAAFGFRTRDTGRVVDILAGRQADNGKEIHVMGLRIVRQIVAAHGGHADFLKKEAGGYGVEFVLPVEG